MSLDLAAVSAWMAKAVPGAKPIEKAEKIQGGQSNPTYVLHAGDTRYVLRRKPGGVLLKSAHAVEREFRVQSSLFDTDVPVPRMLALCEDEGVIGSAFYIMAHVEGRSFDDPRLPDVPRANRYQYFKNMARVLASIYKIDIDAVGLSDYGPRGNYFRRQIDRWSKQYRASETEAIPAMDRLIATLDRECPEDDGQVSLVHGDFRIDNLLFAPEGPDVIAVLDWELSTLGHPYADLAAVIMQWQMPVGETGRGLAGVDRAAEGLMSDQDFLDEYCRLTGQDGIMDFGVHVAFCFFRMAAILQGVKRRALDGNASDPERGLKLGELVPRYAEAGLEALDVRS
ncbi:MAG: macrolide phosphotransferase Mph [Rhodobacteraceae bacterium HLUCCO18]|nr:MAG: macrolide phosphotransferase Mph [Rhodobacteraceae bacterium HLUCCO18]